MSRKAAKASRSVKSSFVAVKEWKMASMEAKYTMTIAPKIVLESENL